MPPVLLLFLGMIVTISGLWQLRLWIRRAEQVNLTAPARFEAIVEELVSTAEAASAAVAEKTEELEAALERADRKLEELEAGTRSARPQEVVARPLRARPALRLTAPHRIGRLETVAPQPQPVMPELHRRVYQLVDAGHDVTAVARQLSVTKGEVQLILNLRRM